MHRTSDTFAVTALETAIDVIFCSAVHCRIPLRRHCALILRHDDRMCRSLIVFRFLLLDVGR